MKTYKWSKYNKSNKAMLKFIGYLIVLIITILAVSIATIDKEIKEEFKLISVSQHSGKIKYFKEVNGERIHIDKITLESLMKQYDVVVEEVK